MSDPKLFSLECKVALVTGASSGLGEHFAEVLASAGATVVLAARRTDKLASVVSRIEAAGGCACALDMDVTSAKSVQQGFKQLDEMFETLDIVVNNAGIASAPTRFVDAEEAQWAAVLDVNLTGAWRVAQASAKRMKHQRLSLIHISEPTRPY